MSALSTFEGRGIVLNNYEKKSFYSFLALYLGSSLFFLLFSSFWYYDAQKNALEQSVYYKLQHFAERLSSEIIHAHMSNSKLILPKIEERYEYFLVPLDDADEFEESYYEREGMKVLVSSAPQKHLDIKYVVVKTDEYHKRIVEIQRELLFVGMFVFLLIAAISYFLSKLFMRPIHTKVKQIEQFILDISHELNTPITALSMSAKRAMQKGAYDQKILTNISISAKQLYSIYKTLAFLTFKEQEEDVQIRDLQEIVRETISYYEELCLAKDITVVWDIKTSCLAIADSKARLLFSNLLSNSIKYSMPHTTISMVLKEGYFHIQDEGIGIAKEKQERIFKPYERASNLAGGFGIGLSSVKRICDDFGIAIEILSQENKGSTFILRWK